METPLDALLRDAAERGRRDLEGIGARPVCPQGATIEGLTALGGPLPEGPSDPVETLALLDALGSPATVATAGPRYFGFVTGGALPAALATNWLAGAWDQNAFSSVASPAAVAIENIALGWLLDVLGLPVECGAAFVTGATMANVAGLAAARHAVLARAGWDVEAQGLFGAPPITVVVGEEAHATVFKALGLLGLGRERVLLVPADDQGRMRTDAFPPLDGPAIVCLQAGNVNTGAFDPLAALIPLAHAAGAWAHVDGAFGLWAGATPTRAHLVRGIA